MQLTAAWLQKTALHRICAYACCLEQVENSIVYMHGFIGWQWLQQSRYTLRSRWHRRNEHRHAAWQAGSETDSLGSTPDKASKIFMYVPTSTVGPTVCMGTGLPSGACCYFSASICTSGKFGSMAACMYACRRNLWHLTHKYYGRRSRGAMTMSRHQHARKRAHLHTARVCSTGNLRNLVTVVQECSPLDDTTSL